MIIGIGTDITDIQRIAAVWQRQSTRFSRRILTANELSVFASRAENPTYLATRFAAKEALSKAFGTGIGGAIGFHDIEVGNSATGAPLLTLSGRGLALSRSRGVKQIHLSLSDERDLALAFVVLEG